MEVPPSSVSSQAYWLRRAARLRTRVNLAKWLDRMIPWSVGITVVGAVAVLGAKHFRGSLEVIGVSYLIVLFVAGMVLWRRARPQCMKLQEALVHLEVLFTLHNRLTAAAEGVGSWPSPPKITMAEARWRWPRVLSPIGVAVSLLAVAAWIPVTPAVPKVPAPVQPPLAWEQMEEWIETLKEEKVVEEVKLEEWEAKLEALRAQPKEEWFDHSSLEAGDSLKEQFANDLQALESHLDRADQALGEAMKGEGQLSEGDLKELQKQFDEAIQGLEAGGLPFDGKALRSLKNLDVSKLRQLSPGQLAALKKRLREGRGACKQCKGNGKGGEEGSSSGKGENPGRGDASRGRGDAPLTFEKEGSSVKPGKEEDLVSQENSEFEMGELIGTSQGAPEVKPDGSTGGMAGGALGSKGGGGARVWSTPVTPEERKVLRRFFK